MAATIAVRYQAQLQEQHQEGEGAAPAAAPSGGGDEHKGPSVDSAADVPLETLSDDDKIIEDLRREYAEKELAPEEDPPKRKPGRPRKEAKEGEPEPAKPKAKADGKPEKQEPSAKWESPEAAVSAVVSAIEKGDRKALARALGKPESFFDVSDAKWLTFREQQNSLRARDRDVTQREHTYNENVAAVRKEYGPPVAAAKSYREGNYGQFVQLVEGLTGEKFDESIRKVTKGELSMAPEVKSLRDEIASLRAEQQKRAEEEKRAREEADAVNQKKAAFQRALESVTEELAGHRVSKLPNFQRQVLSRVRDSWDPEAETYTMSFEEAADAIIEERDSEAQALGYVRPPPKPNGRGAVPLPTPSVPSRAHAADARVPDGEPWMNQRMDDDEIIESIRRDIRAGRLKAPS